MADTPIFKLNSNPSTSVTLPGFEKSRTIKASQVYLVFEGLTKPRSFRSPTRYEIWAITALFPKSSRTLAQTFMTMIDTAFLAADNRFLMTPGGLQVGYTDRLVELSPYTEEIEKVSGTTRVSFIATEVSA